MASPILPSNPVDPTGANRLERGAINQFKKRLRKVGKECADLVYTIPATPVVNKSYEFRLDPLLLDSILRAIGVVVETNIMEETATGLWIYTDYVEKSYIRGTNQEFANLSNQSEVYKAGRKNLATIIGSEPYQRRIALVKARVFEEMQGFSAGVKADMSRVLTEGIGRGLNPRDIANNLNAQAGIEMPRANRIARTEISTALRRARWDEAAEAEADYGIRQKLMHISALSPTTRHTHAERHGNLYTQDEVRDWYSQGANSINCRCSQVAVTVDENGDPIAKSIIDRAKDMLKRSKVGSK